MSQNDPVKQISTIISKKNKSKENRVVWTSLAICAGNAGGVVTWLGIKLGGLCLDYCCLLIGVVISETLMSTLGKCQALFNQHQHLRTAEQLGLVFRIHNPVTNCAASWSSCIYPSLSFYPGFCKEVSEKIHRSTWSVGRKYRRSITHGCT